MGERSDLPYSVDFEPGAHIHSSLCVQYIYILGNHSRVGLEFVLYMYAVVDPFLTEKKREREREALYKYKSVLSLLFIHFY